MDNVNPYAPPRARVADAVATVNTDVPFFPVSTFKLVLMSVCTLGVYELYWFYKNWQLVKARDGSDIYPFWRAFFGVFFCYSLFTKVRDHGHPDVGSNRLPAGALAFGWIVATLMWRLPDPYSMCSLLAFVFMIPVQMTANRINSAVEPEHDRNGRLTWLNWVGVVIGGLVVALAIVGSFLPEE